MQCAQCQSEWKTNNTISQALTACPFCGASLADEDDGKSKFFDNSKDALSFIMKTHGVDALLGKKLKSFFPDYASSLSFNIKRLVFAVYEYGASDILKGSLTANQEEKENAFKRAVAKLTEAFIAESAAEQIIREFTDALGWEISLSHTPQVQSVPQAASVPQKQQAPTQTVQRKQPIPAQPKSAQQSSVGLTKGQRNVKFGAYNWRVLDVKDDRALLLSEDIIERRAYNVIYTDVTWENCTLRQYLNGAFLQTFSSAEQARILQTNNANENNQWFRTWFRTKGGNNTTDSIFLLSIEEVVKYFGDSGQLRKKNPKSPYRIDDQYNNERVAKYVNGAWWWLRSPGNRYNAASVGLNGNLDLYGEDVRCQEGGVRPVLWLNL